MRQKSSDYGLDYLDSVDRRRRGNKKTMRVFMQERISYAKLKKKKREESVREREFVLEDEIFIS